jgi:hypothetical protein
MSFGALFLLLLPIGIALFIVFDLIVWWQYENHHDEWEKDDKPAGFFWKPEGSSWKGNLSRSQFLLVSQVEKVPAQFFITELGRTAMVVGRQLPNGARVSLRVLAESPRNCISSSIRCRNGDPGSRSHGGSFQGGEK